MSYHVENCCVEHGCMYGEPKCPVVNLESPQDVGACLICCKGLQDPSSNIHDCYVCKSKNFQIQAVILECWAGKHVAKHLVSPRSVCTDCGERTYSMVEAMEMELRSCVEFLTNVSPPTGEIVMFVRKVLGLRMKDLAALTGVEEEVAASWVFAGEEPSSIPEEAVATLLRIATDYCQRLDFDLSSK